jgi:GTP-sensing pleiotropic transcriptional regulator CodY
LQRYIVGIIVTGMQDATEQMKVEIERRQRANLTKKYFNLSSDEVAAINNIFEVLDADGSEVGLYKLNPVYP